MKQLLLGLTAITLVIGAFVFYRYMNPIEKAVPFQEKLSEKIRDEIRNHQASISVQDNSFKKVTDEFTDISMIIDSTLSPGCFSDRVYFYFNDYNNDSLSDLRLKINSYSNRYTKTNIIYFLIDDIKDMTIPDEQDFEGSCERIYISLYGKDIFQKLGAANSVKIKLSGREENIIELSEKEVKSLNRTYKYYTSLKEIYLGNKKLKEELEKESKDGEKLILF